MASGKALCADRLAINLRVGDGFAAELPNGSRIAIKNRKACALLAYLALTPHGIESRERLAGLLWSDRSEEQARASLRQCLKQLRGTFDDIGLSVLVAERQEVAIQQRSVRVDVNQVLEALQDGKIDKRLASSGFAPDRILYGFEGLDQAYAAWLQVTREQWSNNLTDLLQGLLRDPSRDASTRQKAAEALIAVDGTHEEAHRYVIADKARRGEDSAAVQQYNRLWELLEEEFDMEPAEETQQLIARIKAGTFAEPSGVEDERSAAEPTRRPAAVRLPVIGVREFTRGGPGLESRYLVEGFRRELIAAMVHFREWIVVEGELLLGDQWQTGPPDRRNLPPVDYELEGTHFAGEDSLRLVITLKDTTSRRYIWSESFVLDMAGWFSAQQEVVKRVSVALNVYLSTEKLSQHVGEPDVPVETYEAWLKGQELISQWDPEAEHRAEAIFRRIIAETPSFAPAYSSLASIFNARHLVFPGLRRSSDLEEQALHFAKQSVNIDPLDTRSQLALAWSSLMSGRFDQAEIHYGLSNKLNPNNPVSLVSCAHGLSFCGEHDSARQLADQALDICPIMPSFHWGYMMCIRFFCGDYVECVKAADRAGDAIADLPAWKSAALGQLGDLASARSSARRFLDLVSSRWQGATPSSDDEIVDWFLQAFPIRRRGDLDHLRKGLHKAGLPVPAAR